MASLQSRQTWVLSILIEGAVTIYLVFVLVYMSLTYNCPQDTSAGNGTRAIKFGEHGFDTGLVALAGAFVIISLIFTILCILRNQECLEGYTKLVKTGLAVSVLYLVASLAVLAILLSLQFTNNLSRLSAGECFHEWHMGLIAIGSASLLACIVTIIVFATRRSGSSNKSGNIQSTVGTEIEEKTGGSYFEPQLRSTHDRQRHIPDAHLRSHAHQQGGSENINSGFEIPALSQQEMEMGQQNRPDSKGYFEPQKRSTHERQRHIPDAHIRSHAHQQGGYINRGVWTCDCGNISLRILTQPSNITHSDLAGLGVKQNAHDFFRARLAKCELESVEVNVHNQVERQRCEDWTIKRCTGCWKYTHAYIHTEIESPVLVGLHLKKTISSGRDPGYSSQQMTARF